MENRKIDAMTQEFQHQRRQVVLSLATLMGISMTPNAYAKVFSNLEDGVAAHLASDEIVVVATLSELILPATDTPGAIGAGVPMYIQRHLKHCLSPKQQAQFKAGIKQLNNISMKRFGHAFSNLSLPEQKNLVRDLESMHTDFTQADRDFFVSFKSLTVFSYYTSEVGATQELAYLSIPGGYQGNFPFSRVGRAWAL
jgi:hypothetical protein